MANYEDMLQEIFSLKAAKSTDKHLAVKRVCEVLGNPHLSYKVIHVTGTCGKGTVTMQTAQTLHKNGHKVGMVISPHLINFHERISVNFQPIPPEYILQNYPVLVNIFKSEGFEYSFEPIVCILGFMYLRDCQVEYGVIEVGCGGTRDSSNIVDPVVSIITSVGLDHMSLLGNTIEEIAIEKAGVMKPNRVCVIGPNTPQELLLKIGQEKQCRVIPVTSSGENLNFIQENSKITEKVFEIIQVSQDALNWGLKCAQPFRYQEVKILEKTFVVDVGHNEMSIKRVIMDCKRDYGNNIRIALAVSIGKNPAEFISLVAKHTENIHLTTSSHSRLFNIDALVECCSSLNIVPCESLPITSLVPVLQGLKDDVTIIIGSCFLVEDIIKSFPPNTFHL